jgi:hypothetical protein
MCLRLTMNLCFHDSSWEHDGPWERLSIRVMVPARHGRMARYLRRFQQQGFETITLPGTPSLTILYPSPMASGSAGRRLRRLLAGRQGGWQEPTAVGAGARLTTVAGLGVDARRVFLEQRVDTSIA